MAYEERLEVLSRPAGADLSNLAANQYRVVRLNASGHVIAIAATTDNPFGVLQNDPRNGQAARVATGGVSKVRLGGTVAAGDRLGVAADGRAVVGALGSRIIGTAITSGVANDIISVNLNTANAPIQA